MRKLGITGTDRAPFVSADWHDSPEKSRALAYNARSFFFGIERRVVFAVTRN